MRIDDLNRAPVTQGTEQSVQTAQQRLPGRDPLEKDGVAGSDQAEVSQLALSLAPPDPERIEQLRLQVESGTYELPSQTLANTLIHAHLQE
jgi:anti-sigma28 factor (negative regulator of flagellin synthesis)